MRYIESYIKIKDNTDAIVKCVKTTCGQKFIDCLGPTIFNSLEYDIKQKLLYYKTKNNEIINDWLLSNLTYLT